MTNSKDSDGGFDSVLHALKWNGMYQVVQMAINMLVNLTASFTIFSIIFTGFHVPSQCQHINETTLRNEFGFDDRNLGSDVTNITYSECEITINTNGSDDLHIPCINGYTYPEPRDRSINSDWDLVCGKSSLSDLLQSLSLFGSSIGSLVFTVLADKKGRKMAHCAAGITCLALGIGISNAPSYSVFAVFKAAQGAAMSGMLLCGSILYVEIVPSENRSEIGLIAAVTWGLCLVLYAAVAYLMRNLSWRLHQLMISLTYSYYLLMPWLMDESIRWLGVMGRYGDLERILRKAARMNGKDEDEIVGILKEHQQVKAKEDDLPKNKSTNVSEGWMMFKDSQILVITLSVWFIWITNYMTYGALSLTSTEFHQNKFIGFGLSALMELLSAPAFWLTVDRLGRKKTTLLFHFLAGISLVLSVIFHQIASSIPSFNIAVTTLTMFGKFSISTSFWVIWIYTAEMYPTTTRNLMFGMASLVGSFGGVAAPFSRTLHRLYPWAVGAICGSLCMIVCVLVRFLPETTNQELPQTVADMKRMMQNKTMAKKKEHVLSRDTDIELESKLI